MNCNDCKTEIPENSKFCLKCGKEIKEEIPNIKELCHDYYKMGYLMGIYSLKEKKKIKQFRDSLREIMPEFLNLIEETDKFVNNNYKPKRKNVK